MLVAGVGECAVHRDIIHRFEALVVRTLTFGCASALFGCLLYCQRRVDWAVQCPGFSQWYVLFFCPGQLAHILCGHIESNGETVCFDD